MKKLLASLLMLMCLTSFGSFISIGGSGGGGPEVDPYALHKDGSTAMTGSISSVGDLVLAPPSGNKVYSAEDIQTAKDLFVGTSLLYDWDETPGSETGFSFGWRDDFTYEPGHPYFLMRNNYDGASTHGNTWFRLKTKDDDGTDSIGFNWVAQEGPPYYAGAFFWDDGDAIAYLNTIDYPTDGGLKMCLGSDARSREFCFLGNNVISLFETTVHPTGGNQVVEFFTDGVGNIGRAADHRPDEIHVKTTMVVGAGGATQSTVSASTVSTSGFLRLVAGTELTIASGAITLTGSRHTVDTESDAALDDLDTISGGTAGDMLVITAADGARTVTVKDGTGNIEAPADCALDSAEDTWMGMYDGTNWLQLACNNNS